VGQSTGKTILVTGAARAWGLRTAGVAFAVVIAVLSAACLAAILVQEARVFPGGPRIITTLLHRMRRIGAHRGPATMCASVGQGSTVPIE
jgi:hypothetical protein